MYSLTPENLTELQKDSQYLFFPHCGDSHYRNRGQLVERYEEKEREGEGSQRLTSVADRQWWTVLAEEGSQGLAISV